MEEDTDVHGENSDPGSAEQAPARATVPAAPPAAVAAPPSVTARKRGARRRREAAAKEHAEQAAPVTPVEAEAEAAAEAAPGTPADEAVVAAEPCSLENAAEQVASHRAEELVAGPRTLLLAIGSRRLKLHFLDAAGGALAAPVCARLPAHATPSMVLASAAELLTPRPAGDAAPVPALDRLCVAVPGSVSGGVVLSAPRLHRGFRGLDLGSALASISGRSVQVLPSAGLWGLAAIEGQGAELVVTLGAALGSALFVDGCLVPGLDLSAYPARAGRSLGQHLGRAARRRLGTRRWAQRVVRALRQVLRTFHPRVLYIGGKDARHLPPGLPQALAALGAVRLLTDQGGMTAGVSALRQEPRPIS